MPRLPKTTAEWTFDVLEMNDGRVHRGSSCLTATKRSSSPRSFGLPASPCSRSSVPWRRIKWRRSVKLDGEQRAQLWTRFQEFRNRARIEAGRMEDGHAAQDRERRRRLLGLTRGLGSSWKAPRTRRWSAAAWCVPNRSFAPTGRLLPPRQRASNRPAAVDLRLDGRVSAAPPRSRPSDRQSRLVLHDPEPCPRRR